LNTNDTNQFTIPVKTASISRKIKLFNDYHKAQGQTLNVAGLDLTVQCFFHGKLYVTQSRVTRQQNLFVLAPEGETLSVVYPEIFNA